MKIAILLYDNFTALDCIGPYEVLHNVPGNEVEFVALKAGPVTADSGTLSIVATSSIAEVTAPDMLLIPGGPGDEVAAANPEILNWVRKVHKTTKWTTSVCTGALILAAAGVLDGLEATTHWCAFERLKELGAKPTAERVVRQGKIVTGAGVSAGIDMALQLVALEVGDDMAKAIQLGIEYDPQPPFDCGSPAKAPAEIADLVRSMLNADAAVG
jgi:putative intracellular protease/amidase